jgi:hypothetical protein
VKFLETRFAQDAPDVWASLKTEDRRPSAEGTRTHGPRSVRAAPAGSDPSTLRTLPGGSLLSDGTATGMGTYVGSISL